MDWLSLALISYFILAITNLGDKFFLDKVIPSSRAYVFLVGLLGSLTLLASPWLLHWPGWSLFFFNLLVGGIFTVALSLTYKALRLGDASKILVIIGGAIPFFSLLFSIIFLHSAFSSRQWLAILLLLTGTIMMAWLPSHHSAHHKILTWLKISREHSWQAILIAVISGLLFALFFVGTKFAYGQQNFASAFIWIRLGTVLTVLCLLLSHKHRREIFTNLRNVKNKRLFFLSNQGLAAIGFTLQNLAISTGPVAIINALQGAQYVFLLVLGGLITVFYPKAIKESISKLIIFQKAVAIAIISYGLYFLF